MGSSGDAGVTGEKVKQEFTITYIGSIIIIIIIIIIIMKST